MARVVAVFDDLLLGSNVLGMLRAAGHEAQLAGAGRCSAVDADVLVVDLGSAGFDGVALSSACARPARSAARARSASTRTCTTTSSCAPRRPASTSSCRARAWRARAPRWSSGWLRLTESGAVTGCAGA